MAGLGEHARGVTHNLIANLIVAGGAAVIGWVTGHRALLFGLPSYLAILIGLVAAAMVSIVFAAVSVGISKWRIKEKAQSQDPPGQSDVEKALIECQSRLAEVERKLTKSSGAVR